MATDDASRHHPPTASPPGGGKETIPISAAARRLRLSEESVRRLIKEGWLKGDQSRKGGWWRVTRGSVEAYEKLRRARLVPPYAK